MKNIDPQLSELLTVEQFALRLAVSRTTAFDWLKTGVLVQGKHYFKVGRILRFIWDETVLLTLGMSGKITKEKKQHKSVRPKDTRHQRCSSSPPVNLDY